jgi:hypothetical protein
MRTREELTEFFNLNFLQVRSFITIPEYKEHFVIFYNWSYIALASFASLWQRKPLRVSLKDFFC